MGSQILVHDKNAELPTTNLSLKSIAYTNRREMNRLVDAINRNTEYNVLCTQYTTQLTILVRNLLSAAQILKSCIQSYCSRTNKMSTYNNIIKNWGFNS